MGRRNRGKSSNKGSTPAAADLPNFDDGEAPPTIAVPEPSIGAPEMTEESYLESYKRGLREGKSEAFEELRETAATLAQTQRTAAAAAEQLEQVRKMLQQQETIADKLKARVSELDRERTDLAEQLDTEENRVAELGDELQTRTHERDVARDEVAQMIATVQQASATVAELERDAANRANALDLARAHLTQRTADVERLQAQLHKRDRSPVYLQPEALALEIEKWLSGLHEDVAACFSTHDRTALAAHVQRSVREP